MGIELTSVSFSVRIQLRTVWLEIPLLAKKYIIIEWFFAANKNISKPQRFQTVFSWKLRFIINWRKINDFRLIKSYTCMYICKYEILLTENYHKKISKYFFCDNLRVQIWFVGIKYVYYLCLTCQNVALSSSIHHRFGRKMKNGVSWHIEWSVECFPSIIMNLYYQRRCIIGFYTN